MPSPQELLHAASQCKGFKMTFVVFHVAGVHSLEQRATLCDEGQFERAPSAFAWRDWVTPRDSRRAD
jgi:hypothetical protein